jgi:hypothetical protein
MFMTTKNMLGLTPCGQPQAGFYLILCLRFVFIFSDRDPFALPTTPGLRLARLLAGVFYLSFLFLSAFEYLISPLPHASLSSNVIPVLTKNC